jgi:hypothetical protein
LLAQIGTDEVYPDWQCDFVPLGEIVDDRYLVATCGEAMDGNAADVARPAGNDDLHVAPFRVLPRNAL